MTNKKILKALLTLNFSRLSVPALLDRPVASPANLEPPAKSSKAIAHSAITSLSVSQGEPTNISFLVAPLPAQRSASTLPTALTPGTGSSDTVLIMLKNYIKSLLFRSYSAILVIFVINFLLLLWFNLNKSVTQMNRMSISGKCIKLDLYFIPVFWLLVDKEACSYLRQQVVKWRQNLIFRL